MVLWGKHSNNGQNKKNHRHAYLSIYFPAVSKNQQKNRVFYMVAGTSRHSHPNVTDNKKIGLTPSHKIQIIFLTPKSTVSSSFAISLDSFSDHAISACCNCREFCRLQSLCYLALYIQYF